MLASFLLVFSKREFPIGFSGHLFYCRACVESWGGIKLQQTRQRDSFAIQTWMSNPKLNLYYYFFPLICIPVLFFKYIPFKFFYITDVYKCLSTLFEINLVKNRIMKFYHEINLVNAYGLLNWSQASSFKVSLAFK